jgi:hypothetical protein
MSLDKKDIAQDTLDAILQDDFEPDALPGIKNNSLPAFKTVQAVSYVDMKSKSTNKAKGLMNSLLKFYLSEELISKNDYITARARIEMTTMAGLIQQMEIADRAITMLMMSIDGGDASPRMFEVLAGLQRTMLDIMKHQTLQILATEESMKKLKRDIDIYSDDNGTSSTKQQKQINSGGTVARGSRDLMREIQEELGEEKE